MAEMTVQETPILFLGDSPDLPTGLARIGRDLAWYLSTHSSRFRVGYLGRSGMGSSKLPFAQYIIPPAHADGWSNWGMQQIEAAWRDFAGDEPGIVFTIFDPTRLLWLSCPHYLPAESPVREFLLARPFRLWGYFPIDASGPDGRLSQMAIKTLKGFDRVLAYTNFGARIICNSIGSEVAHLPHGYNPAVFYSRGRAPGRNSLGVPHDAFLVGTVGTNQARKDWGATAEMIAILRKDRPNLRAWWHSDALERFWSLPALLHDFGIADIVHITLRGTENQMAEWYSACDVTFANGLGEGFGYPIVESQACGVPCVHVNYAGGAEFAQITFSPEAFRYEGLHNAMRPVLNPVNIADVISIAQPASRNVHPELAWAKLWPKWQAWFEGGLDT